MSSIKRYLEKMESYRCIAKAVLLEIDAIEECPICGYYLSTDNKPIKDIYAIATKVFKEKYIDSSEKPDFKVFHDAIDEILHEAGIESINEHIEEVH